MRKIARTQSSLNTYRIILSGLVLIFLSIAAWAQTPAARATASISGRVMEGDQPAAHINVTVSTTYQGGMEGPKVAGKAVTDGDGRFQLNSLAPGKYVVTPRAPAYVVTNIQDRKDYDFRGNLITLDEGETIKDLNFTLVRGGVITGQITDPAGRPVIGQLVVVTPAEKASDDQTEVDGANSMRFTDDRGIYRVYGLLPGKYLVSCGRAPKSGGMEEISYSFKNTFYQRVFYPTATTKDEATTIEVAAGSEIANIDLRLGKIQHGFHVAGRAVNNETGVAIGKVFITASRIGAEGKSDPAGYAMGDENGEFTLQGLVAGNYKLYTRDSNDSNVFFPETTVEVTDADVEDVILRAKSGLTVSGTVVVDNTSNSPLPFSLSEIHLFASTSADGSSGETYGSTSPSQDGSFTISGLAAGRMHLAMFSNAKGTYLRSVDRGGVPQPGVVRVSEENPGSSPGMLIGPDNPANNLTVHLEWGNCRLRGSVLLADGTAPNGATIQIVARRIDGGGTRFQSADMRGRFLLEFLVPGQWEITARVPAGDDHPAVTATRTVTISNGADNNVTLTAGPPAGQER